MAAARQWAAHCKVLSQDYLSVRERPGRCVIVQTMNPDLEKYGPAVFLRRRDARRLMLALQRHLKRTAKRKAGK